MYIQYSNSRPSFPLQTPDPTPESDKRLEMTDDAYYERHRGARRQTRRTRLGDRQAYAPTEHDPRIYLDPRTGPAVLAAAGLRRGLSQRSPSPSLSVSPTVDHSPVLGCRPTHVFGDRAREDDGLPRCHSRYTAAPGVLSERKARLTVRYHADPLAQGATIFPGRMDGNHAPHLHPAFKPEQVVHRHKPDSFNIFSGPTLPLLSATHADIRGVMPTAAVVPELVLPVLTSPDSLFGRDPNGRTAQDSYTRTSLSPEAAGWHVSDVTPPQSRLETKIPMSTTHWMFGGGHGTAQKGTRMIRHDGGQMYPEKEVNVALNPDHCMRLPRRRGSVVLAD